MAFRCPGLLPIFAALLAACGGRSQLRDSADPGSGGGGPAVAGCLPDGPPIELAGSNGHQLRSPLLIDAGDGSTATLVAGWTSATQIGSVELRHTTFAAWGTWPTGSILGPSYLADLSGGLQFTGGSTPGGFELLFPSATVTPNVVQLYSLSPLIPGSGAIPTPVAQTPDGADPLLMIRRPDAAEILIAYDSVVSSKEVLDLTLFNPTTSTQSALVELGCANTTMVCRATPSAEGYILAFSSGTTFGDPVCKQAGAFIGFPSNIDVIRVHQDGKIELTAVIPGNDSNYVSDIEVTPRSDGAWISWRYDGGMSSPIEVARVDPQGTLVFGPVELPFDVDSDSTIAATSLGDHLALGWSRHGPGTPTIQIRVLDDAGGVVAETHFDLASNGFPPALLASRSRKSLLVSWIEGDGPVNKLLTARLGCILP